MATTILPPPLTTFTTLPEMLRCSETRFADRPLFGTYRDNDDAPWIWTSYAQFGMFVRCVRDGLAKIGVDRGDRVAVISANRLEFAITAFAAFERGASIVAMYENQTDENWEYIVRDSGAKALFVSTEDIRRRIAAFQGRLPALRHVGVFDAEPGTPGAFPDLVASGMSAQEHPPAARPEDLATIIYTSGTTGEPKGVPLTHANICANILTLRNLFPLGPEDRSLSFLPWAHIFGQVVELHSMMCIGASVAICDSTERIIPSLAEVRPTILFSVPRIYDKIHAGVRKQMAAKPAFIRKLFDAGIAAATKRTSGASLSLTERCTLAIADRVLFAKVRAKFGGKLRFAVSGGASLAREVGAFVDALGIQVYEAYGLTETGCISTNVPGDRKMGSVGRPITGVHVMLDTSASTTPGEGEIMVRGPSIMRGYFNRPEATAEAILPDGSFRTGDLGRFDADGHLFITGRIKELYKLANGKYVAPAPLEDALKLSPFILNAMVYGDNRQHNVALIVPDVAALTAFAEQNRVFVGPEPLRSAAVLNLFAQEIEKCSASFHSYERIKAFAFAEEDFTQENGLLTPTFKLRRRNVMARYGAEIEKLYA
jgi:long-chain acyl-CoA synthetase